MGLFDLFKKRHGDDAKIVGGTVLKRTLQGIVSDPTTSKEEKHELTKAVALETGMSESEFNVVKSAADISTMSDKEMKRDGVYDSTLYHTLMHLDKGTLVDDILEEYHEAVTFNNPLTKLRLEELCDVKVFYHVQGDFFIKRPSGKSYKFSWHEIEMSHNDEDLVNKSCRVVASNPGRINGTTIIDVHDITSRIKFNAFVGSSFFKRLQLKHNLQLPKKKIGMYSLFINIEGYNDPILFMVDLIALRSVINFIKYSNGDYRRDHLLDLMEKTYFINNSNHSLINNIADNYKELIVSIDSKVNVGIINHEIAMTNTNKDLSQLNWVDIKKRFVHGGLYCLLDGKTTGAEFCCMFEDHKLASEIVENDSIRVNSIAEFIYEPSCYSYTEDQVQDIDRARKEGVDWLVTFTIDDKMHHIIMDTEIVVELVCMLNRSDKKAFDDEYEIALSWNEPGLHWIEDGDKCDARREKMELEDNKFQDQFKALQEEEQEATNLKQRKEEERKQQSIEYAIKKKCLQTMEKTPHLSTQKKIDNYLDLKDLTDEEVESLKNGEGEYFEVFDYIEIPENIDFSFSSMDPESVVLEDEDKFEIVTIEEDEVDSILNVEAAPIWTGEHIGEGSNKVRNEKRIKTLRILQGKKNCKVGYPAGAVMAGRMRMTKCNRIIVEPVKGDTAALVFNYDDVSDLINNGEVMRLAEIPHDRIIHIGQGIDLLRDGFDYINPNDLI